MRYYRGGCLNTMPRAKVPAKYVIISFIAAATMESGRKAEIVSVKCQVIPHVSI